MRVRFLQGMKQNLPSSEDINALIFTVDTGEIYKGQGNDLPLLKMGDVIITNELPQQGIGDKVYVKIESSGNICLYIWDSGTWRTMELGEISQDIIDLLLGFKNKNSVLTYDTNGNIINVTTTGEVQETIDYEYDDNFNIIKETAQRQGKVITNTFSYDDSGNIIGIDTVIS